MDILSELTTWNKEHMLVMTYAALKGTESTLKNVHDGIVKPFPFIDYIVIMDTSDDIGWRVIFAEVFAPFFCLFQVIPTTLVTFFLFVG